MTQKIVEAFVWGLASGLVGVVYRHIIAKEEFFNRWWRYGAKYEGRWFFKPLWSCAHCFAGQLALWSYTGLTIVPAVIRDVRRFGYIHVKYSWAYAQTGFAFLFLLIVAVAVAVFVAKVVSFIFERQKI